ncbi:MAG: hypothetical protein ACRCUM_02475 [Mycoplasmoidaceae bacterium]
MKEIIRKCLNCNIEFTVQNKNINKKFCSVSCSNKYNWANASKVKVGALKECKECKKKFKAKTQTQLFCGPECRNNHNKKNRAKQVKLYIRECKNCGKEFKNKNRLANYCTDKCRIEYNNKKKIQSEIENSKINCNICGKEFKRYYDFEKYCSLDCINTAQLNKIKSMNLNSDEKIIVKNIKGIIPYEFFLENLTFIYPSEAIYKIEKTFKIDNEQAKKIYLTCRKFFCRKVV